MTNFAIDLSRFVEKAHGRLNLAVRKIALDIFSRIVLRTPVDEGRARGNWNAEIGSPSSAVDMSKTDKSGGTTVAQISSVVAKFQAGEIIYLANNVPYIIPLELGHSKQAPNGMVGITLTEFGAIAMNAAAEASRGQ